jgi:D-glycerate 3-kinase
VRLDIGDPSDLEGGLLYLTCRNERDAVTTARESYSALAQVLAEQYLAASNRVGRDVLVAMAGGQGSGKSTLAAMVIDALARRGTSAFACSLDDFYLTRAERDELARRVHPLLATRGVPGTHDVRLLEATLDALRLGRAQVPVFDKGIDDRTPISQWRTVSSPPRVIVLEGWCLGARPEPLAALATPINELEATEDRDGRYRRYVNDVLGADYARLNARFDHLTFLAVPGIEAVRRWRADQERSLPAERRMSAPALVRFIAHYERLTRWMLADVPARADLTVELGESHDVKRLAFRDH